MIRAVKTCKWCRVEKPFTDFYKDDVGRDGRRPECKECTAARRKRWYGENREQEIQRVREWQQRNHDAYLEKQADYRARGTRDHRAEHLRRTFGMTHEAYDALLEEQGGCCAICGRAPKPGKHLHVDHDHDTGEVRGLLCFSCNVGVGNFGNDVERLERTVDYLETRPAEQAELAGLARERAGLLSGVA